MAILLLEIPDFILITTLGLITIFRTKLNIYILLLTAKKRNSIKEGQHESGKVFFYKPQNLMR